LSLGHTGTYRAAVSRPGPSTTFAILGSLEVVRDGTRIQPESIKLRTLLVDLLLHHGQTRSADRLIDDLWGDAPPATAVGVLQNYISQLRKLLGTDVIRRDGTGYRLEIAPDQLDRDRFVELVDAAATAHAAGDHAEAIARVREALALWRGDALADVAGADFAQPEIARLRETRAAATDLLFDAELALGRYRETVPALEAALATEPLRERLWWLLMTALYRSGRQADALRAYQRARQTLVTELGIEPGPELRELEQAVLEQRTELAPKASRPRRRPAQGRPKLTGRASELETIKAFIEAPVGMLLLTGEPGIGKTRLLEEAQLRFAGSHVVGRAFEAERGRPYGPWVDALRSAGLPELPAQLRDALAPLLPELSDVRAGLENTTRLYDAVGGLLRHLAHAGGVLVVLDDVQWLDERSASLLHFAVRQLDGTVAFLASARPLELAENQPCARALEALRRAELTRDLLVSPLAESSIDELARRETPGGDVAAVAGASNGNPLLALEMARAIARGDDPLSSRVDALIADRLAGLSPAATGLVPWMAAFGRSATPAMLAAAAGRSTDDLVEPLTELERFGVFVAGNDGAYDFAHDLVRDAAYRRLPTARRTMLHDRIGKTLLATPDPDDILAADAARHANAADDGATCAAASVRAAQRCLRLLAYPEAAAHVATGRQHARRLQSRQRVALDLQLVDVLLHPGLRLRDPGALSAELADLCALAQQLGMTDELSTALTLLARVHHWGWGDIARASALMERTVQLMQRAVTVIDGSDAPMAEPLLQGARCLAYLEIDSAMCTAPPKRREPMRCWRASPPPAGTSLQPPRISRLPRRTPTSGRRTSGRCVSRPGPYCPQSKRRRHGSDHG
jgi:DNA-binding SARP family transcriptional activator